MFRYLQKTGQSKLFRGFPLSALSSDLAQLPVAAWPPLIAGRGPNSKPREEHPEEEMAFGRFWSQLSWLVQCQIADGASAVCSIPPRGGGGGGERKVRFSGALHARSSRGPRCRSLGLAHQRRSSVVQAPLAGPALALLSLAPHTPALRSRSCRRSTHSRLAQPPSLPLRGSRCPCAPRSCLA